MKIDACDIGSVGIIVLDEPLRPDVPNLDAAILRATSDAGSVWMELDRVDSPLVVDKCVYELSRREVPKLDCFVVRSWGNESSVRRELASSDPILMSLNGEDKFSVADICDLELHVICSWEKELPILRETKRSHRTWMGLDDLWVAFNRVVPKSDGPVSRARGNQVSRGSHFDIIYVISVADEPVRAHRRFEVPHHDCIISRSWHDLLEIRVECNCMNHLFMTFEWSLQCWITLWLPEYILFAGTITLFTHITLSWHI